MAMLQNKISNFLKGQTTSSAHGLNNNKALLSLIPKVKLTPINLFSTSVCYVPNVNSHSLFKHKPTVRLSPLKPSVISKYNVKLGRPGSLFPVISKCNAKRCGCCKFLSCKSNIRSSVNGRTFNIKTNIDLD